MRLLSPDEPLTIDDLIPRLNASEVVSPSELIAILFELELDGVVRQLPGKAYVKVWQ
ncbi:MAG: hypothetical protein ACK532_16255 [Acidobacteriota bacterium]